MTPWELPDFDDHEGVHFFRDPEAGLTAIIAIHSTVRGPSGGGARFWHYTRPEQVVTDALRLSRGMSYKNAMAGLPVGGGKGVILADAARTKTPELLRAFGRAIDSLGGRYVTAEDVGIAEADMIEMARETRFVSGLPVAAGAAGGDPGPVTAQGVYLGVKAAIRRALGTDSAKDVHVAIQGVGSVGGGLARRLAAEGARLTLADVDRERAERMAGALGASVAAPDSIASLKCDVFSPNALGAILDARGIAALDCRIVAGGANNQLGTAEDAARLHARDILYAPDYVINAGGIINVMVEYLGLGDRAAVDAKVAEIPGRLEAIWDESARSGSPAAEVADAMARRLIGR